jgi:hypothetical protein
VKKCRKYFWASPFLHKYLLRLVPLFLVSTRSYIFFIENEKINEIERTRVRSPPQATSFF